MRALRVEVAVAALLLAAFAGYAISYFRSAEPAETFRPAATRAAAEPFPATFRIIGRRST